MNLVTNTRAPGQAAPTSQAADAGATLAPAEQDEISFLSGVNADGSLAGTTYWDWNGNTPAAYVPGAGSAHKWGGGAAGSPGGTVAYWLDPASGWSAAEQGAIAAALALWADVANIRFAPASSAASAQLTFTRGHDGGAWTSDSYQPAAAGGSALPATTSATISIDTHPYYWSNLASFTTAGGYGPDTLVHEMGHMLGLGHAGPYNGAVSPGTQQYGAYDTRSWSVMSYIGFYDTGARYAASYPVTGTNWGLSADGYYRTSTTFMPLDILAVQRLYGLPSTTPLSGGQVFGFHCNVAGPSRVFFDFTVNTTPIVTLWDAGGGNRLDLSGFSSPSLVNLNPGTFSSCAGMVNNLAIAYGTRIDGAIGGAGDDTFIPNADNDVIDGGGGTNVLLLPGTRAQYTLTARAGTITLTDTVPGRGGTDVLTNIRYLRFADQTLDASTLPATTEARSDFDGDGHSDIVLQDASGAPAICFMNGSTVTQAAGLPNPGSAWSIAGTGDLDGDGHADLLWRRTDGTVAAWLMNGRTIAGSGTLGNPGTAWRVVGTGDFNGDGRADILFRNSDGTPAIWFLNGTSVTGAAALPNPGSAWSIAGIADLNGDGHDDILWRRSDGMLADWLMNGASVIGAAALGNPGTAWRVVGTGDFNGDGRADILFRSTDGTPAIWFLNGTSVTGAAALPNPGSAWTLEGAADLNGDGRADLLWQKSDGTAATWLMNGASILGAGTLAGIGGSWHVLPVAAGATPLG